MDNKVKTTGYRVKQTECAGCGLCAESCPRNAISLQSGQAHIIQSKCNQCGLCVEVCPQGAIIETTPVSAPELHTYIQELKERLDNIITRIEKHKSSNG